MNVYILFYVYLRLKVSDYNTGLPEHIEKS